MKRLAIGLVLGLLVPVAVFAQSFIDWQKECASGQVDVSGTTVTCYLAAPTPTPGGVNLISNPHCDGRHNSHFIAGWSQSPANSWDVSYWKNPSPTTSACRLTPPDGSGTISQTVQGQPSSLTFTFISIRASLQVRLDGRLVYEHYGSTPRSDWMTVSVPVNTQFGDHTLSFTGSYSGNLGLKFLGVEMR